MFDILIALLLASCTNFYFSVQRSPPLYLRKYIWRMIETQLRLYDCVLALRKDRPDRTGVGRDAVKLSFTILAAALSLALALVALRRTDRKPITGLDITAKRYSASRRPASPLDQRSRLPSRSLLSSPPLLRQLANLFARFCRMSLSG